MNLAGKVSFRKKLDLIFDKAAYVGGGPTGRESDRYIPKAYSSAGPGWGVFDQREKRFLSDREVKEIDADRLRNEKALAS